MVNNDELQMIRRHMPAAPPPSHETRRDAWGKVSRAVQAERRRSRFGGSRRWVSIPALGAAALIVAAVTGVVGPPSGGDRNQDEDAGTRIFGPAVVQAVEGNGYTDVHFLDPSAEPSRIRAELEALGIDLRVEFLPVDPFKAGHLLYEDGASDEGIELLGQVEDWVDAGVIGIRVPDGWSGNAYMSIGRAAEPGETFSSGSEFNAERPGGPLHCESVRGLSPAEAAEVVHRAGLEVEWRTEISDYTSNQGPPADFTVHDVIWYAPETVLLFAEAGRPELLSEKAEALITQGCDGKSR